MSNNLHVYLSRIPPVGDVTSFFVALGYSLSRVHRTTDDVEPDCHFWSWEQFPLSGGGIELLYFDGSFTDNTKYPDYEASVVIRGSLNGSEIDLAMVDITASLLLSRYGGVLHNPQRIDRKYPNLFINGVNNPRGRS